MQAAARGFAPLHMWPGAEWHRVAHTSWRRAVWWRAKCRQLPGDSPPRACSGALSGTGLRTRVGAALFGGGCADSCPCWGPWSGWVLILRPSCACCLD